MIFWGKKPTFSDVKNTAGLATVRIFGKFGLAAMGCESERFHGEVFTYLFLHRDTNIENTMDIVHGCKMDIICIYIYYYYIYDYLYDYLYESYT